MFAYSVQRSTLTISQAYIGVNKFDVMIRDNSMFF